MGEAVGPQQASPTSADLLRDGKLAALSGLAYAPPAELSARLHHAGLELQAHGTTHFTRWFIARQAPSAAGTSLGGAAAEQQQLVGEGGPQLEGKGVPQQFIFFRGVSWRSADLDALRVWQGLMRALPSPFLPHLTSPPELLLAHRCGAVLGCSSSVGRPGAAAGRCASSLSSILLQSADLVAVNST